MQTYRAIAALTALSLLAGCSSTPRAYRPNLTAAPPNSEAFQAAAQECQSLLVNGKLGKDGRSASIGGAAGAGAATTAVGGATAAAVAGYGGAAIAAATVVLLPFAIVGGAVGMAKIKRAKKEAAIHRAMAGCLAERGYQVAGWTRLSKAEVKADQEARLAKHP